jgi:hypothetical protein
MCGGWGIYSPDHQKWPLGGCCRMAHRTVRCASHVSRPLGFDRWSSDLWGLWAVRRCANCACFDSGAHCSALNAVADDRCARSSRCSTGTPDSPVWHRTLSSASPDSPVNYSGAPLEFPKVASSASSALVHRTLSGAPDQGAFWDVFCSLCLTPCLVFLLTYCEPLAPVELID